MNSGYTMKQRYKPEDIEIETVKPKYKFPRNIALNIRRTLLDAYRLIPEHWRDKIEEFGKKGFSSSFRNMVIADWFSHTFLIGDGGRREAPPEPAPMPEPDFRDGIRHHGGPHHGGDYHDGPHHGGPHRDGDER